jgi:SAM-dependent methyltransferase
LEPLAARLRHLVPREVRERYYATYALMTGKSQAAAVAWEHAESQLLNRAVRRVDLFGELFDQRMHRLETRVSKLEDRLTDLAERSHAGADEVPFDDKEYFTLELTYRGDEEALVERYRSVASMLEPGSEVLELGSGTGTFLRTCHELGHRAVGVDRSEAMVSAAVTSGLEVTLDDAITFLERQPDASFDCIAAFHLVEHLPGEKLRALCTEIYRALRSGGQFVAETPNVGSMKTMLAYYYIDPSHRRPRGVEQYLYVLKRAGFSDVRVDVLAATGPGGESPQPALDGDRGAAANHRLETQETMDEEVESPPRSSSELEGRVARLEELVDVASDIRLYAQK